MTSTTTVEIPPQTTYLAADCRPGVLLDQEHCGHFHHTLGAAVACCQRFNIGPGPHDGHGYRTVIAAEPGAKSWRPLTTEEQKKLEEEVSYSLHIRPDGTVVTSPDGRSRA